MPDLIRAEFKKMVGNYRTFSFLVLIYPIAAFTILLLLLLALLSAEFRQSLTGNPAAWNEQFLLPWQALSSFPQNIFLRLPFLAFVAVVFAGEYQWQTWKNIVPRNRRAALILAKFLALTILLLAVGLLTSLVWGAGRGLLALLTGAGYTPAAAISPASFARDYLLEAALATAGLLILAGYAALVATRARSILAGVLVSLGLAIVEPVSLILLLLAGRLFDAPSLVRLFRFTPTFNLDNVRSWLLQGQAAQLIPQPFLDPSQPVLQASLLFSLVALFLWLGGLVLLTILIFRRQDLTA